MTYHLTHSTSIHLVSKTICTNIIKIILIPVAARVSSRRRFGWRSRIRIGSRKLTFPRISFSAPQGRNNIPKRKEMKMDTPKNGEKKIKESVVAKTVENTK